MNHVCKQPAAVKAKPRIVQIAAWGSSLYAVSDDGRLWKHHRSLRKWLLVGLGAERLGRIRQIVVNHSPETPSFQYMWLLTEAGAVYQFIPSPVFEYEDGTRQHWSEVTSGLGGR